MKKLFLFVFTLAHFHCYVEPLVAAPVLIATDHPSGVYELEQDVQWTILRELDVKDASYTIKAGGWTVIEEGPLQFEHNQAILNTPLTQPGTLLLEVNWINNKGKKQRALGGIVCAPDKIEMSHPAPEDFDQFWAEKIAELNAVPAETSLEKVDLDLPEIDYWKIKMRNIRDTHIQGQLARPIGNEPKPALLVVQYAGVYPLNKEWVTQRAAEGWLALNIQAHDIPIDEPGSYYKDLKAGALSNYNKIGKDDREESYFLRMFLSCYRAADYLTQRPDWDGKTLVVVGGSQGGYQALMTAGLHPKVTAAIANVPAGCDLTGTDVGRKSGWPGYYNGLEGEEREKVREAARYYDVANFASRIDCPVMVAVGLIDEVCSPEGVFAATNNISSSMERLVMPQAPHGNVKGSHTAFRDGRDKIWLPALVEGLAMPPSANASH